MKTFEVNSPVLDAQFYRLPVKLYAGNENWFAPLGGDLDQVFNPARNSLFQCGNLKRWIALDAWNNMSGRIAAFFSEKNGKVKGGFGFFESTEDYRVTECLLSTAFSWLRDNNCTFIEGPVNFGEKDRFWGLLTSGFNTPCLYLENYNPPFYETFLRQYGLQEKDSIYTFEVNLNQVPHARLKMIAERLKSKYDIDVRPFSFSNLDKMVVDVHEVYVHSFKENTRLKLITPEDIHDLFKQAQPVLSDELIWLAYHHNKPVGFLAFMKDLNQIINNNMNEIHLKGFAIAVVPGFRKMGVELGLSYALFESVSRQNKPCTFYFAGINSKTEAMVSFMKKLNATIIKSHTTFQFNSNN